MSSASAGGGAGGGGGKRPRPPDGVHLLRVKRSASSSALAEQKEANSSADVDMEDAFEGAGGGGRGGDGARARQAEAAQTVARLLGCSARGAGDIEDLVACLEVMHEVPTGRTLPPVVPCHYPFRRTLEPGTVYRWCACGRSGDQPWCDSSCREGDPESIAIVVERTTPLSLCGCKYSGSAPVCDGSHVHWHVGTEQGGDASALV